MVPALRGQVVRYPLAGLDKGDKKMPCKVTFQTGRKGHAAHNDRSMYEYGAYDTSANLHWDYYAPSDGLTTAPEDAASVEAERRYYDEHYGALLASRNARRLKQSHPEDVWTMTHWAEKNPPHETILQIGKMDDDTPDELKRSYAVAAALKFRDEVRKVGGEVISIDVHFDEASPHAHVRWVMNDDKGKPNVRGCLSAHGYAVEKNDRKNNPMKKWSAEMRDTLEILAESMGADLDKERTSRRNISVRDYVATQAVQEALKIEEQARGIINKNKEQARDAVHQKQATIRQLDKEIQQRKKRIEELQEEENNIRERIAAMVADAQQKLIEIFQVMGEKDKSLREKIDHIRQRRSAVKSSRDTLQAYGKPAQMTQAQNHAGATARAASRNASHQRSL